MSITKEALEDIRANEVLAEANTSLTDSIMAGQGTVVLHKDTKLESIEHWQAHRVRARGIFNTANIASFGTYTKIHAGAGATAFVADDMSATAVLNLGTQEEPGHADNVARLQMVKTAPYKALLDVDGKQLDQRRMVEFFEDWIDHIKFFDDEHELPKSEVINAIRKISIKAESKSGAEVRNLSETRTAFESVTAEGDGRVPSLVYFDCLPYEGLQTREFTARLSVLTTGEKPLLVLRIRNHQLHIEEMATELADMVKQTLDGSNVDVVLGSYKPGA